MVISYTVLKAFFNNIEKYLVSDKTNFAGFLMKNLIFGAFDF